MNKSFYIDSPTIKANCIGFISPLDCDQGYTVTVDKESKTERRKSAQNKLMWHWNKEASEQRKGLTPDYVHGISKLNLLLPLYLEWGSHAQKRGRFIEDVMAHIPEYETKVGVAYDMVRTRKLGVKRFAEYLDRFSVYWSNTGVVLTTSADFYYEAMGREVE